MRMRLFIFTLVFAGSALGAHRYFDPTCPERLALKARHFGPAADAANWQAHNRRLYERWVAPLMTQPKPPNPYRHLPGGIPPDYLKSMEALVALNLNNALMFQMLQELEKEVVELSEQKSLSLKEALFAIIQAEEKRLGFAAPVHLDEDLSPVQFAALLTSGQPVIHEHWRGKPRSRDGQRIKSIIEARYLKRLLGDESVPYLELYLFWGNSSSVPQALDWSKVVDLSSIDANNIESYPTLWSAMRDTSLFNNPAFRIEALDFTNQVFFALLRELLPGLEGWE